MKADEVYKKLCNEVVNKFHPFATENFNNVFYRFEYIIPVYEGVEVKVKISSFKIEVKCDIPFWGLIHFEHNDNLFNKVTIEEEYKRMVLNEIQYCIDRAKERKEPYYWCQKNGLIGAIEEMFQGKYMEEEYGGEFSIEMSKSFFEWVKNQMILEKERKK